jgi:predicted aspartyl protease
MLTKSAAIALLLAYATSASAVKITWHGEPQTSLAAEVSQNVMFTQLTVHGKKLRFLVDTGAAESVLDADTAARLKLKPTGAVSVATSGAAVTAGYLKSVEVSAPGVTLHEVPFLVTSLGQMATHFGRHVDGILGYEVFARFSVTLDYEARQLRLAEPIGKAAPVQPCVPLGLLERVPYVSATVVAPDGTERTGSFLVDTGASGALQLEGNLATDPALRGAQQGRRSTAHGVGGGFEIVTLPFRALQLGPYELLAPRIALRSSPRTDRLDGLLGGAILARFTVRFIYATHSMCLVPNHAYKEAFTSELAGFTPVWTWPDLKPLSVESVSPGSPAEHAGLRAGDVIEFVDRRPGSALTVDDLARLMRVAGAKYELRIRRAGAPLSIRLELPKDSPDTTPKP